MESAVDEQATDQKLQTMGCYQKQDVWDKKREKVERQLLDGHGKYHHDAATYGGCGSSIWVKGGSEMFDI